MGWVVRPIFMTNAATPSRLSLLLADRLETAFPSANERAFDRGCVVHTTDDGCLTWRIEPDGLVALVVKIPGHDVELVAVALPCSTGDHAIKLRRCGEADLTPRHVSLLVSACKALMPYKEGSLPCVGERTVRGAAHGLEPRDRVVFQAEHHAAQALERQGAR